MKQRRNDFYALQFRKFVLPIMEKLEWEFIWELDKVEKLRVRTTIFKRSDQFWGCDFFQKSDYFTMKLYCESHSS